MAIGVVGAGAVAFLGLPGMGGSPSLGSGVWPLDLVVGTGCQPRTVFLLQMQPADVLCGPGQVTSPLCASASSAVQCCGQSGLPVGEDYKGFHGRCSEQRLARGTLAQVFGAGAVVILSLE